MLVDLYKHIKPAPRFDRWEQYFDQDEILMWEGAPKGGVKLSFPLIFLSFFGMPFLGAGLFLTGSGVIQLFRFEGLNGTALGLFFAVFGLPFLAGGLFMVIGTWLANYYAPLFVRYAISNKRVYVAESWWNNKITSHPILPGAEIGMSEGRLDTVWITAGLDRDSDGDMQKTQVRFEDLTDGSAVYALLRKIQHDRGD